MDGFSLEAWSLKSCEAKLPHGKDRSEHKKHKYTMI
jgi:hypothetical protein